MEGIMTVADLRGELERFDDDTPVMIAVIKYPEEFAIRVRDGQPTWMDSTDVEVHPLEHEEVTKQQGFCTIAVELDDYDRQRHFAGG